MQCPKCQFENPESAKFCNECGSKLEFACPQCGKANPPGSKFCNGCGHDLKELAETPAIDFDQPQSYTPKLVHGCTREHARSLPFPKATSQIWLKAH